MNKWDKSIQLLACPLCTSSLFLSGNSTICENGHCFDISHKGYINMLSRKTSEFYSPELFDNRSSIFNLGFYNQVLTEIERIILDNFKNERMVILDAGCGEGFWLSQLCSENHCTKIGIDISKDAIVKACKRDKSVSWLVSDLSKMPVKEKSIDVVLSIFSPSNYSEFNRILTDDGIVIKVVPNSDYLLELRKTAGRELEHADGEDSQSLEYMQKHMNIISEKRIVYSVNVTKDQAKIWAGMTPMLRNADLKGIDFSVISTVTVSVTLIFGRKSK